MAKYKVFDNIIAITNHAPEEISNSADFSKASIDRRIAAGYHDAKIALSEPPKRAVDIAKAITLRGSKQEQAEEHGQKPMKPPEGAELPSAGPPIWDWDRNRLVVRITALVSALGLKVSPPATTLDLAGSRCFQWYVSCQLNWRTSYYQKPATVFNELTYAEFVITNQAVLRILD